MKVFISFSGTRSRNVANALRRWLPDVIQAVEPWTSDDLDPGVRWNNAIAEQLQQSRFGILCITPENLDSNWMMFEAGAVAKTMDDSFVCPYLFELELGAFSQVVGPLVQFQSVTAKREGTLRLLRGINKALGDEGLSEARLIRSFRRWWPMLERELDRIGTHPVEEQTLSLAASTLGLENVHPTRSAALERFAECLHDELKGATEEKPARIWIVASSLNGFLSSLRSFDGLKILGQAAAAPCDFRVLLTHPKVAEMRARQERRDAGQIATEVGIALERLRTSGIRRGQVRYYEGAPTVFAVATSEWMLLNPYPYEREAYRCFSVIVRNTRSSDDIYDQYLSAHFQEPWDHALEVPEEDWGGGSETPRVPVPGMFSAEVPAE